MMLSFLCAGLMGTILQSDSPQPSTDVKQSYQEAKAKAGRSPDEQVKLALWCESHGLTTQKLHHLTLAILADPRNVAARGLMGLVAYNGRWLRPETIAEKFKTDPERLANLAEYESKRLRTPYTADAQFSLGVWADDHGLKEQARAHLTAVTRLDPLRDNAWKRLGYKKHDGRWITDGQLAAEKAEAEAQKIADRKWKPLLEKYKAMLGQSSKREEAEAALVEVTDPRAVPMIGQVFARAEATQPLAVQLLGQVDSPAASRTLAGLAVFSKSTDVRRLALETLKRRDPRDFVKLWIALIHKPIKFEVKPVGGPGSPGTILIEGDTAKLQRRYSPPGMPDIPTERQVRLTYDANGLPVLNESLGMIGVVGQVIWLPYYSYDTPVIVGAISQAAHGGNIQQIIGSQAKAGRQIQSIAGYLPYAVVNGEVMPLNVAMNIATIRQDGFIEQEKTARIPIGQMTLEREKSAQSAQEQLNGDVASLNKLNEAIRRSNASALQALKAVTGLDLGEDPIAWSKWLVDQQGYVLAITQTGDKPTIIEDVPLGYMPQTSPQIVNSKITSHHACFAAGTSVRTIDGERPIESIRQGDLVLVQETKTGALSYQGIITAYHNPPNATLKIRLGSDTVVATGIHRFWKAGQGWTMARDLKAGDRVRTLEGVATVEAVDEDRVQPVFNLEVGEGHSFLVGKLGALVHDNSLVEPALDPFDSASKPAPAK
jgi:hypothetical protein